MALLMVSWLLYIISALVGYIPVYIGRIVFSEIDVLSFLATAIGVTVIGAPLLWWRIQRFRSVLKNGVAKKGKIYRLSSVFGQARIDYIYLYQGQRFQNRAIVRKTRKLGPQGPLQSGATITVIVHQFDPTRALISDLYS